MNCPSLKVIDAPLRALLLVLCIATYPAFAHADYDNDMAGAQECFDNAGRQHSRNVIHCLRNIEQYTDQYASTLKCGIRIVDQGLIDPLFGYPWFLVNTEQYLWLVVVNTISDRDISRGYAARLKQDCIRSQIKLAELLGEYYYLRSLLLEATSETNVSSVGAIAGVRDPALTAELGVSMSRVVLLCNAFSDNAPLQVKKTSMCVEALKLRSYPGLSPYDKFLYGLLRSRDDARSMVLAHEGSAESFSYQSVAEAACKEWPRDWPRFPRTQFFCFQGFWLAERR